MPYKNEHAARVKNPDNFEDDSSRRKNIARNKRTGKMETQAYRFKRKQFTSAQAKTWLKEHDVKYIRFEPATGGS